LKVAPELAREVKEVTAVVHDEYVRAVSQVKARSIDQVDRSAGLFYSALSESRKNSPIDAEALHAFAWARRCLGASQVAAPHFKLQPEEQLAPHVGQLLSEVSQFTISLEISDPTVKVSLIKLKQIADYFAHCASLRKSIDAPVGDPVFGEVSRLASEHHHKVQAAVHRKAVDLLESASAHVDKGCQAVRSTHASTLVASEMVDLSCCWDGMSGLYRTAMEIGDAADDKATACAEDPAVETSTQMLECVGEFLRTLREAELRLVELVPELDGLYEQVATSAPTRVAPLAAAAARYCCFLVAAWWLRTRV
jgi:hypothetical protein